MADVVLSDLQTWLQGLVDLGHMGWALHPRRIPLEAHFSELLETWYAPENAKAREATPNPAYNEAAHIVIRHFTERMRELGLLDMTTAPLESTFPTSIEIQVDSQEVRRFAFPCRYRNIDIEVTLDFFHSHDKLAFPRSPLVTVRRMQS